MSNSTIDIVLRVLGAGQTHSAIKGASDDLNGLADSSKKAGDAAAKVGKDTTGFTNLEAKAKSSAEALKDAKAQTENLNAAFEKTRNWGVGMALAGGAGAMLSNELIKVAQDSDHASDKLEAMAKKRGEGGRFEELANWASDLSMQAALIDDDPINEAAAGLYGFGVNADQIKGIMPGLIGQSRLYNQSLDETTMAFGKAFASGNVGALRRVGVTMSDADTEYVKKANTELERSQRLYEVVRKSMDNYALSITDGMSESEKALNRQKNAADTAFTAIGHGSEAAQASISGFAGHLLTLVTTNEKVASGFGWVLTVGSNLLMAGGSLMALVGQAGQAVIGFQALKAAHAANALATEVDTAATGLFATADWDAAMAAVALAGAEDAAAASTVAVGVAATGAAAEVGILGVAMTAVAGAGVGMIALFTGLGIAAGVALAGIIYKLGQMLGLLDKNGSMLTDVKRGWEVLTGNKQEAEAGIGRDMYDKDIAGMKAKAADMRTAGKSEAEIDGFTKARTAEIENSYAAQFKAHGDEADYIKHSEAAGAINSQAQAAAAMPAFPTAPPVDLGAAALPSSPMVMPAMPTVTAQANAAAPAARRSKPSGATMANVITGAFVSGQNVVKAVAKASRDPVGNIRITFDDIIIPQGGLDSGLGAF